jgi:hypothetical protein
MSKRISTASVFFAIHVASTSNRNKHPFGSWNIFFDFFPLYGIIRTVYHAQRRTACCSTTSNATSSRSERESTPSGGIFDTPAKEARLKELTRLIEAPDFWNNQSKANTVLME